MTVIKNFGFGEPLIKKMQGGDYFDFSSPSQEEASQPNNEQTDFWRSRMSTKWSRRDAKGNPDFSFDSFQRWCDEVKSSPDAWENTLANDGQPKRYLPFSEAREYARSLKLNSGAEWRRFCRGLRSELGFCPDNIPSAPERAYRNSGWRGYRDWLGIEI